MTVGRRKPSVRQWLLLMPSSWQTHLSNWPLAPLGKGSSWQTCPRSQASAQKQEAAQTWGPAALSLSKLHPPTGRGGRRCPVRALVWS